MRRVKVAQIGMGHDHSWNAIESILSQPEVFELVGFAVPECEENRFAERISKYRDEFGVPKLSVDEALNYPGLDGVVIETEERNLTEYAQMAVDKGLSIHMDKPGGMSLGDFERLIDTVKSKTLVFSTGYMYRFNPCIKEAIERAKSGELGDIYCIEAHMDCLHPAEKRQWLEKLPGGMMFFLGCHLVDVIYQIQGEPCEVIPYNMTTGYDGVTAEDFSLALLRYKNGISFVKSCAAEPGGFMRRQIVICGTKGTIEINPIEAFDFESADGRCDMYSQMRITYGSGGWYDYITPQKSSLYNRYDEMMKSFAQMIRGEKVNPYTYDYELEVYKLVLRTCGYKIK